MKKITLLFLILIYWQVSGYAKPLVDVSSGVFKIEVVDKDLTKMKAHGADPGKVVKMRKLFHQQRYGTAFLYINEKNNNKYLITCLHVVEAASEQYGSIVARDINNNEYKMKLKGADTFYDLAILEFEEGQQPKSFFTFKPRSKPVHKTEDVICIGFAYGEKSRDKLKFEKVSVSSFENDFVSDIGGYGYYEVIRAMKSGMSGGPVVDKNNQWVGMIARFKEYTGNPDGYTLVLDVQKIHPAIQRIFESEEQNRIERCFMGIAFHQKIEDEKYNDEHPVTIGSIIDYSSADRYLGEKVIGQEVIKINNISIKEIKDVYKALEGFTPGKSVNLQLKKENQTSTVTIKTKRLKDRDLTSIAYSFFKNNKNYALVKDGSFSVKSHLDNSIHEFDVAGFLQYPNEVLYLANSTARLGTIIRLCSTMGYFQVKTNNGSPITIKNAPETKADLYKLRVLYY